MNRVIAIIIAVFFWGTVLGTQVLGRFMQCLNRGDEGWRLMQEAGYGLGLVIPALILCIWGAIGISDE
jgi:MFS family permease